MSAERLSVLQSMVDQDPSNTFARYGLAMEFVKLTRYTEAMEQFELLLQVNPDYSAGYYHAGRTLELMGETDKARAIWEKGIEVTTRTGDSHTRSELQAALDLLI